MLLDFKMFWRSTKENKKIIYNFFGTQSTQIGDMSLEKRFHNYAS